MLRNVTIVQGPVGRQLSLDDCLLIFRQRPDFIILPEYYNVDPTVRDTPLNALQAGEHLKYCRILSDRFEAVVIAGTAVEPQQEEFYNTAIVYHQGEVVGRYRKRLPTPNEMRHGIRPGSDHLLLEINGVRFSALICADVLDADNFSRLAEFRPDIIFVPTTSPFRPQETVRDKFERDQKIFVAGAEASGSYIVKCCAVGEIWGGKLQGRSLAAAPWGILSRITPDEEDRKRVFSVVLDVAELREFRRRRSLSRRNDS